MLRFLEKNTKMLIPKTALPEFSSAGKVSPVRKFRTGETFFLHVFQVVLFHHCGATGTESTEVSPV